ncbi:zinc ribbon domain-containing protein, partial [Actinomadura sp. NPDC049753]|uniref:zinc ribbon domain-containing protein n=1 Tax=Actinomadura sp. NPDC049753 TaxID=3154739 RepID=UPI00342AD7ED
MTDDHTRADDTAGTDAPGTGRAGTDQGKAAELACPACGAVVFAEEIFCEECGHRLADGPPAASAGRDGATIRQESAPSARRADRAGQCPGWGGAASVAGGYSE